VSCDKRIEGADRAPQAFKPCPQVAVRFLDRAIKGKHLNSVEELFDNRAHPHGRILGEPKPKLHGGDDAHRDIFSARGMQPVNDVRGSAAKR